MRRLNMLHFYMKTIRISTFPGSSRRAGKKVGFIGLCYDGCLLKLGDLEIIFMIPIW